LRFDVVSVVTHPNIAGTVFAATAEGGVYRSIDAGATWTPLDKYGTVADLVNVNVMDPSNPFLLFAGTEGYGVQASTNGGQSYVPRVNGLTNFYANAIAFDPDSPSTIYTGTDSGIFKSTDSGNNWALTALTDGEVTDLVTDNEGTAKRVWATVAGEGVAFSPDGGTSFNLYTTGLDSLELTDIEVENLGAAKRVWATMKGGSGIAYSDDLGQSWISAAGNGLTDRNVNDLEIDSGTAKRVWATTDSGVFFSESDGLSWTELSLGLPSGIPVTSISIDPHTREALVSLFSEEGGGVYRGGNISGLWRPHNDGLEELKVRRLTNDSGHAVDSSTLGATFYAATAGDGVYASELLTPISEGPIIATLSLSDGELHSPYSETLAAQGGAPPYVWSLQEGGLPPGLGLDPTAGVISGQPAQPGLYDFTVQVGDQNSRIGRKGLSIRIDDPNRSKLSVNDASAVEGGAGTVFFTVTLSGPSDQTVTVNYRTRDATATAGTDYVAVSGALAFSPGTTALDIGVLVLNDPLDEDDETLLLSLSAPQNADLTDSLGQATITDDDPLPAVAISDALVTEGDSGQTEAAFTVSLSAVSGRVVSVDYSTEDGTATSTGGAIPSNSGAITIPSSGAATPYPSNILSSAPGTVLKAAVTLTGFSHTYPSDVDILLVGPGGQKVILMSDVGGSSSVTNLTLTFDDDEVSSVPLSSLASGTYKPTNSGSGDTFPSPAPPGPYGTLLSAFTGGSAAGTWSLYVVDDLPGLAGTISGGWNLTLQTRAADYAPTSGSLSFTPGTTAQTIGVASHGDTVPESDESFFVRLSSPVNATISDGLGEGSILDDDQTNNPPFTPSNPSPPSGSTGVSLTPSLSWTGGDPDAGNAVTYDVYFGTSPAPPVVSIDQGAASFAPAPLDAGTSYSWKVVARDNLGAEAAGPVWNFTTAAPAPSLSINDVAVTEGDAGTVDVRFTVSLSVASDQAVSVDYATAGGSATAVTDYVAGSGTVTIPAGSTAQTILALVNGDLIDEGDETFFLDLSGPNHATLADPQGVATILDDDDPPSIAINDVTVHEGNLGTVAAAFTVTLSAPSGKSVTVSYATADGTATAGSDYVSAAGVISFEPGASSKPIHVPVIGEWAHEPNETFFLNLAEPVNAVVVDSQGLGTILDEDRLRRPARKKPPRPRPPLGSP
jgi:subtilisin-like proprotein convertase family protein